MRFTAATVAFFAGLAAAMPNGADTTVYQTEEVTIISCGPEVTNCPGRATSTIPSGAAATETSVMTTAVPTTATGGAQPVSSGSAPAWSSSAPAPAVTSASTAETTAAATTVAPVVPVVTPSVIAHTSCSTWYETVTPSAGGAGSVPSGSSPVGSGSGSGSGVPHVPSASKGSAPAGSASASPSATPVFNGAGAVTGSLTFAGAAAAAAFFLA